MPIGTGTREAKTWTTSVLEPKRGDHVGPVWTMGAISKVERAFYRYASHHLREAFPQLPDRSQFNRLQRSYRDAITAFALFVVRVLRAQETAYEVLDSTAVVTRDAKRRGLGWLAGYRLE